jgi:hypothetical protein
MPDPGDTGVYAYGIVPAVGSSLPGDLQGMDGHGVELVTAGRLGAVVTSIALPRPPGRRRDLLSHSEVLTTIASDLDVVPLRFGTVFPDADAIAQELLTDRAQFLTDLLDRVAGAVQLNLRASYVEARVLADVVSGSRDIRRLRERTKHLPEGMPHPDALRLGQLVSNALGELRHDDSGLIAARVLPYVRDSRVRERATPDHVLDVALLVDRTRVPVLEAELEDLADDVHDHIRLQLTGPLAPFDFVEEGQRWD